MYKALSLLFHEDKALYDLELRNRLNANNNLSFDFTIGNNPVFMIQLPELYESIFRIININNAVENLVRQLP